MKKITQDELNSILKDHKKWLSDLDTSKLHYVKVPENHIVIDFDIPDKDGIHLHYIYSGKEEAND